MSHIHQVHSDQGKLLAEIVTIEYSYALPDGRKMPVPAEVAWCRTCRQFTYAESVTTLPELDLQVERYVAFYRQREGAAVPADDEKSVRRAILRAQLKQKIFSSYAALRECLHDRRTPPRCLECGGSSFAPIPKNGEWAEHPGRAGVRVRVHNFGQVRRGHRRHYYSPQSGLRIDQSNAN